MHWSNVSAPWLRPTTARESTAQGPTSITGRPSGWSAVRGASGSKRLLEPFALNRIDPQPSFLRVADRCIDGVPLFDAAIYRRRRRARPSRRSWQRRRHRGGGNRTVHSDGAAEGAAQRRRGRPSQPAQGRDLAHPRQQARTLSAQCTVIQDTVRPADAAGVERGKRVAQGTGGGARRGNRRGRGYADRDASLQRYREDRRQRSRAAAVGHHDAAQRLVAVRE